MKICNYCGKPNAPDAERCKDCGTPLPGDNQATVADDETIPAPPLGENLYTVEIGFSVESSAQISFPNRNHLVDFLAFFMDQIKLGPIESDGRRLTQGELDEVVADAAYITSMNYPAHRFGITFKEAVERFSRGRNHSPYDPREPPSKRLKGD